MKLLTLTLALSLTACQTISPYSATAYQQATDLKAESLTLMDKATTKYSFHVPEADLLRLNLKKAYEYSKGRPKNSISTTQWSIIIDPNRNSVGGFLVRWEKQSILSPVFIEQSKQVVGDGFDQIIELESGKRHLEESK